MAVFRLRYGSREVLLPLGKFTIGRAQDCTLRIDDEHLSRHHAILRVEVDKVAIKDAGSRNGVVVNGARDLNYFSRVIDYLLEEKGGAKAN